MAGPAFHHVVKETPGFSTQKTRAIMKGISLSFLFRIFRYKVSPWVRVRWEEFETENRGDFAPSTSQ
jgi:hypothetical protein